MMRYRLLDTTRAYALEITDRRRRGRRPGRTPRDLLPAMAGADRDRMVDLVERDGTGAPLCGSQQCPGGSGMVLRRQRQCRNRRRTCRCRRAGFPGDVAAAGMSSLVGAGDPRSRRRHSRRGRGDASSGGVGNVVDVHARQTARRRVLALNRSLAIAERARRRACTRCSCWACCTCSTSASEISKPPWTMQGAAAPLPRPLRIRPPSR